MHDQSRTCICTRESKQGGKVRQSLKADSEKNTELPRTGFEPVATGLLVQYMYVYIWTYIRKLY